MGGSLKIDSVQNLITLRADLCAAWNNNEFGVDPNVSFTSTLWDAIFNDKCFTQDNYRITSL
jgi:hypothetical protein